MEHGNRSVTLYNLQATGVTALTNEVAGAGNQISQLELICLLAEVGIKRGKTRLL